MRSPVGLCSLVAGRVIFNGLSLKAVRNPLGNYGVGTPLLLTEFTSQEYGFAVTRRVKFSNYGHGERMSRFEKSNGIGAESTSWTDDGTFIIFAFAGTRRFKIRKSDGQMMVNGGYDADVSL